MPVVAARNRHHQDSASGAQTTLPRPSSMPASGARRTSRARIETSPEPDWQSVEPLLEHFNREDEQVQVDRAARRKAKRAHRPLKLSWPVTLASVLLLSHLVALLWLHGSALAARNRDAKLATQVRQARAEIERTQRKIARLDSSPRIIEWARKRGWREAAMADFDYVNKPEALRRAMATQDIGGKSAEAAPADDAPKRDEAPDDTPSEVRVKIKVQGEGEVR